MFYIWKKCCLVYQSLLKRIVLYHAYILKEKFSYDNLESWPTVKVDEMESWPTVKVDEITDLRTMQKYYLTNL